MTKKNLNSFIDSLDKEGELIRIKSFVNPELEITEVTDRICKSKTNKAILFENTGTNFPVLMNMFGSVKRINLALNAVNLDNIGNEIQKFITSVTKPSYSLLSKIKLLPELKKIAGWVPETVRRKGSCQDIINTEPDLSVLPILKCWPYDGGRFITLPLVITKDPETGIRNVGMYRMQILSKNETAMHWQKYKTGRNHFEKYKSHKLKMPVAVAIGGDPVYTYSATAPLPENIDEFILAGFIRKKKVKLVKCITQNIEVPEDADFVIEGYIDPSEDFILEGPFGDHTGFYSLADWYPKFHVTCITHKKNAVYPATVVGIPPMEDAYLGKASERIFLPPIRFSVSPEINDMNMPFEGVAHNIVITNIKSSFNGQASKVMHAMWGAGQMAFNKILFVVPYSTDIYNYKKTARLISNNTDPKTDIYINQGILDELDHASDELCFGGKICFDATKKEDAGTPNINLTMVEQWKEKIINRPEIHDVNISLINENINLVIVAVYKNKHSNVLIDSIVQNTGGTGLKFIIFTEHIVDIYNYSMLTWITSANIDAGRDCKIHTDYDILTIDATRKTSPADNFKRDWPNVVVMDNITIEEINKKWINFNIGEFIESPSISFKDLNTNEGVTAKKEVK